jgi:SAM-dependent methyltransferase
LSASAVAWARDEVAKAQVAVGVRCASVFDLHLAAGSYDLVYDGGCFHHMPPHRRDAYVQLVARALRPGGTFGLVCFTPDGGSGLTDREVYQRQSLGGGLGYDEQRLRELWGRDFDIDTLRRMHEQPAGAALFGKDFLWVILARRR